jgi:hypothetical protein
MSVKKLLSANLPAIGLPALLLLGGALVGQAALAHHSFTMFEYGSDIELDGTVQEFKFINPHAFIILKVKGKDGRLETWALEGQPTPILEQQGWTRQTLKPGDQIRATIAPLRSGAAGGAWLPQEISFWNGKAVVAGH